ncbi:MAG TPA: PAS domain S-box protein [Candidatus Hydrogenedentes bacterium]|nr:PAS domain S-box protein [Candidatus Hydrogenedentota bacterium]HPG67562.1 PAS domain S-box protein [Candidatus Hydrogenedentota bacterium]
MAILDSLADWAIAVNREGRVLYATPSIEELLGVSADRLEGEPLGSFLANENQATVDQVVRSTLEQGSWQGDVRVPRGEETVVIALRASVIRDREGHEFGVLGVARDVTEQRRTEEALARSEERFREMTELLPSLVCEVDLSMRLTYINKFGIETSGYSEDDLKGMVRLFDLIHPDDRARAAERALRVMSGERLSAEYRMLRKDGSEAQVVVNSSPIYQGGQIVGMRNCLTEITEHRRALKALEISEERHRMLVEAMNDGLGVQDENGVLIQVNDRLCRMFGYSREELLGRRTIELIDGEAREIFYREVAKRKERDRTPYEITFTRRDGTTFSTIMSPAPLFDENGVFRGSFAVLTDITEHKRAEQALEKERLLLRTVMDSVPDAIYLKDRASRFITTNRAHLRALHVEDERDIVGRTDFDFFEPSHARRLFEAEQELMRSGGPPLDREERLGYKSGRSRWVHALKVPLRDQSGEVIGLVGVSRDISKRREAEEALRVTQENLRTILENSRDIAFRQKVATRTYEYVSPCVGDLLGFSAGELLAMTIDDIDERIHPDDIAAVLAYRKGQSASSPGDNVPHLIEYRIKHKNGEYRWFSESATLVWGEEGRLDSIVGTMRDITEQKQAESAVRTASRMEATATLAGGIAHDFNNLMVGVLGNAELLEMKLPERPDIKRMLNSIAKSAQQAGELAQKLLAFARGGKYQPRILNLNESILETLQLEERSFPPNIRIERDFERALWPVRADPSQINQVVMNLSINAVEAIEGQGTITIVTRNLEVDEDFARMHPGLKTGSYAYLAVEDTGKGMTPDVRAKVFEPFFTTKFQGRGLGLAAVYGIVKNHNGHISVYSEPGRGTAFKVYLPAVQQAPEAVADSEPSKKSALPRGDETILVIDDEEVVLSVTRQMLEGFGYKVLLAHDGQEAVDIAKTYDGPIHLSVLDMGMPVMGGAQAYPLLMQARPDMQVIICSGYELGPSAQALLRSGARSFIQKPFRADVMAQEVRKAIDG